MISLRLDQHDLALQNLEQALRTIHISPCSTRKKRAGLWKIAVALTRN
jgi:hypothetical protein